MNKLYGIPNCDTMKKARKWLDAHGIAYRFHNYKKDGLPRELLLAWVQELGWEALLNRRGMMWRKVSPAVKEKIEEAKKQEKAKEDAEKETKEEKQEKVEKKDETKGDKSTE